MGAESSSFSTCVSFKESPVLTLSALSSMQHQAKALLLFTLRGTACAASPALRFKKRRAVAKCWLRASFCFTSSFCAVASARSVSKSRAT